jgi:hypothetical protein
MIPIPLCEWSPTFFGKPAIKGISTEALWDTALAYETSMRAA